eukprot:gene9026-9991_t
MPSNEVSESPTRKLGEREQKLKKPWRITHSDIDISTSETKHLSRRNNLRHSYDGHVSKAKWNRDVCPWTPTNRQGDMIVTSINQSNELQNLKGSVLYYEMLAESYQQSLALEDERFNAKSDPFVKKLVRDIEVARAEGQTSTSWLQNHSIKANELTLKDILKQGIPVRPPKFQDEGQVCQHLKFYSSVLNEFESKLKRHLTICQERMRWLLRDSRRAFGLITAQRPCVLLDISETNTGFGRLKLIQDSLRELISDQLSKKEKLYVCSFGTNLHPLWKTTRDINSRSIAELQTWVEYLQPDGSCNVMSVLRRAVKMNNIDGVVLILGNCPDQNPRIIIDYVKESLAGKSIPFHTVAYNCNISATNMFLEELANVTEGRYHCYSAVNEEDIRTGTDLRMLSNEVEMAVEILRQLNDMRNGVVVENKVISIADQPMLEIAKAQDEKKAIQFSEGQVEALAVEQPSYPIRASTEWLTQHSLKAKGLTLYQVMAPNAFNYVNGYVSSINKSVVSQVHHRSMVQLQWHDGSTKNVHVDPAILFDYRRELDHMLQHYRRRMEWLTTGSRNTFGTIVEKRVVILIDMSLTMAADMMRIHADVKQLLEQQLSNTELYNIICFGSHAAPFQSRMVEPTKANLEATFRWLIQQTSSGSRKIMDAFRIALENYEERKNGIDVDGVYLVTTGIPDEPMNAACSFVQEAFVGRHAALHCIYYEPDDIDLVPVAGKYADQTETVAYLKELAHGTRGRFHWIKGSDVLESDDLRLVSNEVDKCHNYKQKADVLLTTLKQRYSRGESTEQLESSELVPRPPTSAKRRVGPPRQTALSQARINGARPNSAKPASSTRSRTKQRPHSASPSKEDTNALVWKPNTTKSSSSLIPQISSSEEKSSVTPSKSSKTQITAHQQAFYTEIGNETGSVFRAYQVPGSSGKKKLSSIAQVKSIPDAESNITTKEWLHKYSLAKLGLDLNKIINASDCAHSKSKVTTLNKAVPPKYCEIFPTVTINDITKHLHLQARELLEYEEKLEKVLKRYVKRLQWLLSGSRKVFGSVVEKNILLLVDVSGSMVTSMQDLKTELNGLIWEQIYKNKINFSVMSFSSEPNVWKDTLIEPSEDACKEAIRWISDFEAYGGTCTIDAIRLGFEINNVEAIYLLSDGKPDTSTASVLREVATLCANNKMRIHTISFNCDDIIANRFLQLLASQTGGRYHRFTGNVETEVISHSFLNKECHEGEGVPLFEGDDTKRLIKEIKLCRECLKQSQSFRKLYTDHTKAPPQPPTTGCNRITVKDFLVATKDKPVRIAEVLS